MELTPMMQQYKSIKRENPHAILFFRLGDFYEMFFEDAKIASKELDLTLTSRSGDVEKTPMCGVPYHAAEGYIDKLIKRGYKVAIAEQIGDPKAKGLTKREVIQIVTPGTVVSREALSASGNNYIVLLYEKEAEIALAGADISTGECFCSLYEGSDRFADVCDELYRLMMSEIVISPSFTFRTELTDFASRRLPNTIFTAKNFAYDFSLTDEKLPSKLEDLLVEHFAFDMRPKNMSVKISVSLLLEYLHETLKTSLSHINRITMLDVQQKLTLDASTLQNLEITRNLRDGTKKHTLYDVLDFTKTAMGCRLLKKYLEAPLYDVCKIEARLDAIEELVKNHILMTDISEYSKNIYDLERLLTRLEIGTANARDLIALKISLRELPKIKHALCKVSSTLLKKIQQNIDLFDEVVDLIERAIIDEPSFTMREGSIIKDHYDEELDSYRKIAHNSKEMLQEIEEREKNATGIRSLKIGYNKVFGYYIEVRHGSTDLVPTSYIRKQTLANAERYITEELKAFETKILGAEEKIASLEYVLFAKIRDEVKKRLLDIQKTARFIARLDVLNSLAQAAKTHRYVRPHITQDGTIKIEEGRHPLVENLLQRELFVPNNTLLDHKENEVILITGPNMAGKSTYMRQTALITLMAQIGSFVPANKACISPVDKIFTRIGASDDLASGASTFMVEMNEVAHILKYATQNSLLILDEVGRGTSTFDGMSIARAVIEHIEDKIHAKTLFATHYHELTDMEGEKIKNYSTSVKEKGKDIVFLRRIVQGKADKSYGIHVARLAGLPPAVTKRAEAILDSFEKQEKLEYLAEKEEKNESTPQIVHREVMDNLFTSDVVKSLLALDIMTLTPLEALKKLYELQEKAKEVSGE